MIKENGRKCKLAALSRTGVRFDGRICKRTTVWIGKKEKNMVFLESSRIGVRNKNVPDCLVWAYIKS